MFPFCSVVLSSPFFTLFCGLILSMFHFILWLDPVCVSVCSVVWSCSCFTLFCSLTLSLFHFILWSDPVCVSLWSVVWDPVHVLLYSVVWSSPRFTLFCGLILSVFHCISWSDPVFTRFLLKYSAGLMFFSTGFTWNYSMGFDSVKTGVVFSSHPFYLTHLFHSLCCISCLLHTHLGLTCIHSKWYQ